MPEVENKDSIVFEDSFSFNKDVANVFTNMISRSIPDYSTMRYLVYNIGKHFVVPGTNIIDIGCSNGESIYPFIQAFRDDVSYILIDNSRPMIKAVKERYRDAETVSILEYDIKNWLEMVDNVSLALSVLTLQFVPIGYRQKIVHDIYNSLNKGGAFILVEKTMHELKTNELFVEEYYNIKRQNGYTTEQIESKRRALSGVLVPRTEERNIKMLHEAGFQKVECFWRCLNFAGWLCVK